MTRLRNDQLTGSVGDFVRAIALGSLDMADAQLTACALLGIPQPNPAGTARAVIADMSATMEDEVRLLRFQVWRRKMLAEARLRAEWRARAWELEPTERDEEK